MAHLCKHQVSIKFTSKIKLTRKIFKSSLQQHNHQANQIRLPANWSPSRGTCCWISKRITLAQTGEVPRSCGCSVPLAIEYLIDFPCSSTPALRISPYVYVVKSLILEWNANATPGDTGSSPTPRALGTLLGERTCKCKQFPSNI